MYKLDHTGRVKTSFWIDPRLLTQAKVEAARTYITLGLIVEDALTDYLKRHRKKTVQTIYQERLEKMEKVQP